MAWSFPANLTANALAAMGGLIPKLEIGAYVANGGDSASFVSIGHVANLEVNPKRTIKDLKGDTSIQPIAAYVSAEEWDLKGDILEVDPSKMIPFMAAPSSDLVALGSTGNALYFDDVSVSDMWKQFRLSATVSATVNGKAVTQLSIVLYRCFLHLTGPFTVGATKDSIWHFQGKAYWDDSATNMRIGKMMWGTGLPSA